MLFSETFPYTGNFCEQVTVRERSRLRSNTILPHCQSKPVESFNTNISIKRKMSLIYRRLSLGFYKDRLCRQHVNWMDVNLGIKSGGGNMREDIPREQSIQINQSIIECSCRD